jgi:hypothetical protein
MQAASGVSGCGGSHLKLVTPSKVNRTVTPSRRPNPELRTREHLTAGGVDALIDTAKGNRQAHLAAQACGGSLFGSGMVC